MISLLLIGLFFLSSAELSWARTSHLEKIRAITSAKGARWKRIRIPTHPPEETTPEITPLPKFFPLPVEAITKLRQHDFEGFIRIVRMEPASAKTLYLLREAQRIYSNQETGSKPNAGDKHRWNLNLGTAYHNLFLFLKKEGMVDPWFCPRADKFYRRAGRSKSQFDRSEVKLLRALLYRHCDQEQRAVRLFRKVNLQLIEDNYRTLLYLAAFRAAAQEIEPALSALEEACQISPQQVAFWLAIGDDFHPITRHPDFGKFTKKLELGEVSTSPDLKLPRKRWFNVVPH